jgi:formyltetrahydrofolate synthetase
VRLPAIAVKRACAAHKEEDFKFLYPLEMSIQEKIEKIAKDIYGAAEVTYSEEALAKIEVWRGSDQERSFLPCDNNGLITCV